MTTFTDKQQKWAYLIFLIVIPFITVHLFPSSATPRLLSVIWVTVLFPAALLFLIFFTEQPIRLSKYSNPIVEKRLEVIAKMFVFFLAVGCIWYLTIPTLIGTYRVYLLKEPFTVIEASVSDHSSPILATGLYWNIKVSKDPESGLMYLFPTIYHFGDSRYKFIVLTGTSIILDIQPE